MRTLITALVLLTSLNAFADGFTLSLQLNGVDVYRMNRSEFDGDFSRVTGKLELAVEQDGEFQNFEQSLPIQQINNESQLKLSSNRINIVMASEGINATVPALVKKSITGKVRSLKISSEDYLSALRPILEKQGLDVLQGLNLYTEDFKLSTSLQASDYECSVSEVGDLECASSVNIRISATVK